VLLTRFTAVQTSGARVPVDCTMQVNPTAGGGSPAVTTFTGVAGEAIAAGAPVAFDDVAGSPRVFRADANGGSDDTRNCVGFATTSAILGGTVTIMGFEQAVPDTIWDAVPTTAQVGALVYLSANVGMVTITAPTVGPVDSLAVGVVTQGGAGAVKIALAVGRRRVVIP
jgi:hypothetical protein